MTNDDEITVDEQVRLLCKNYGVENLEDVPRTEVFAGGAYGLELKKRWLDAKYNVKEIAYIADKQLDFLEYQAGMADRPDGIKFDDPDEGSNIMSSDELAELACRLDEIEDKVRRIKNSRDRYSHDVDALENEVNRMQERLENHEQKGRLYHLGRFIFG